ncbi:MAG: hypothetical protein D6797_07415 [Bdellovibrio sp.]|nr:MAG: hypothetical protein D6797_07415 [Bdellovibrio sp.]
MLVVAVFVLASINFAVHKIIKGRGGMRLYIKFTALVSILSIMFFFQNCIETPMAPNSTALSSSSFNHALVAKMACQTCHEKDRPPNHHLGKDCKGCHMAGKGWIINSTMVHNPVPETCSTCHAPGQKYDSMIVARMNNGGHPERGNLDCKRCHQQSITNDFMDWLGAKYIHPQVVIDAKNCQSCHGFNQKYDVITAAIGRGHPSISSTQSCSDCHSSTQSWSMGVAFSHTAQIIKAKNCASCHGPGASSADRVSSLLNQGLHPKLNVLGTKDCSFCHDSSIPSFTSWVYKHSGAVSSGSCASCHAQGRYNDKMLVAKINNGGHPNMGGADCISCHRSSALNGFRDWTGATGAPQTITLARVSDGQGRTRAAITIPHPKSSKCSTCHDGFTSGKKAFDYDHGATLGLTKSQYLAKNPTYCVSCHYSTSNNIGRDPNGRFRLNRKKYHEGFRNISTQDCVPCHQKFSRFNIPSWDANTGSWGGKWK